MQLGEEGRPKGRGSYAPENDVATGRAGDYDRLETSGKAGGAVKSVEGYIVFVTGLHQESQQDDVLDAFSVSAAAVSMQLLRGGIQI